MKQILKLQFAKMLLGKTWFFSNNSSAKACGDDAEIAGPTPGCLANRLHHAADVAPAATETQIGRDH